MDQVSMPPTRSPGHFPHPLSQGPALLQGGEQTFWHLDSGHMKPRLREMPSLEAQAGPAGLLLQDEDLRSASSGIFPSGSHLSQGLMRATWLVKGVQGTDGGH